MQREKRNETWAKHVNLQDNVKKSNMDENEVPGREKMGKGRDKMVKKTLKHNEGLETMAARGLI